MTHTHTIKTILTGLLSLSALATTSTSAQAADAQQQTADKQADTRMRVTLYPILVKAPIFGATVDLPRVPSTPDGADEGGAISGSTDTSLNAAYMAGVLVEANRWFVEASGLWAALSASRTTPRVAVDSNTYFYSARGGVRLVGGLSATGGFRRATVDLDATLALPNSEKTLEGHVKPGIWDPLVGVDWRRSSRKWTVDGNIQGGGFGVGADVDVSAEFHARWRVARHLELRTGYSLLYFKLTVADVSIGAFQRTLSAKQSLHGPEIGLGIVF